MARLISASLQAPIPLSWSGVTFDAVASKAGVVNTRPPDNSFSAIGSPLAVFGVWQLPQANIEVTRYLPRSSGVCAKAVAMLARNTAAKTANRIIVPSRRKDHLHMNRIASHCRLTEAQPNALLSLGETRRGTGQLWASTVVISTMLVGT
jgi:hypothetical protein